MQTRAKLARVFLFGFYWMHLPVWPGRESAWLQSSRVDHDSDVLVRLDRGCVIPQVILLHAHRPQKESLYGHGVPAVILCS